MIQVYTASNTSYARNGDAVLIPTEAYTESQLNGSWTATIVHPIDAEGRWKYLTEQAVVKMPSWNGDQLYRIVTRTKEEDSITCTMYPIFYDSMNDCFLVDVKVEEKAGTAALTSMLQGSSKYSATSNIVATNTAYYEYVNFLEALNGNASNSFVSVWGGEVEYDNFTVKVNSRLGTDNNLYMRYGLNIQNISEEVDMSGVVTRVYPKAYNDRLSTSYIDSPLISSYPTAKIGTITFNNIKTSGDATEADEDDPSIIICHNQTELDTALAAAVNAEFDAGLDKPVVNISVYGVFDLAKMEGFEAFGTQTIGLGDTVHLIHSKLDIETAARIVYLKYDSVRDEVSDIQIGSKPYNFFSAVSDLQAKVDAGALDGEDGASVAAVSFQWSQASANVIPAGGSYEDIQITQWSDTVPTYVSGRFYWMRSVTELSNGTVIYGTPVFDLGTQVAEEANAAAANAASAAATATSIANSATNVANQKRRVFTSTPTVPYDAGDIWFDGAHGKTYICSNSKTSSQSYSSSDWTEYITDVSNYFWYDSSGAHVSDTQGSVTSGNSQTISSNGTVMMRNGKLVTSWTGTSSSDAAINFYDCSRASASTADLIASYGRAGITQYINNIMAMALTASGLTFYAVDSNNKPLATFGTSGLTVLNGNGTEIAHLGYASGNNASGGASYAPYATLGTRASGSAIGNYSVAEGNSVTASGYVSHAEGAYTTAGNSAHAEGYMTTASGDGSHAEGMRTTASGEHSHAEGQFTTASGEGSHAEGDGATASGDGSHAGGRYTTAGYDYQTVIGQYNSNKSTSVFEIGWGEYDSKKNVFAVDKSGNVRNTISGSNDIILSYAGKAVSAGSADNLTSTTITNLNSTSLDPGFYAYASTATGVPNSAGGSLLVTPKTSSYQYQVAFTNNAGGNVKIFARIYSSSSWQAWATIV